MLRPPEQEGHLMRVPRRSDRGTCASECQGLREMKAMGVRSFGLLLLSSCVFLTIARCQDSAAAWRRLATADLAAMRDTLQENHPAVYVAKDSMLFRRWLNHGYAEAQTGLAQVTDGRGYYYLLKGYAGGFRDSHIVVYMKPSSGLSATAIRWPGISTTWRSSKYRVAYVNPGNHSNLPPRGATLVACGRLSAETLARMRLDHYEANLDLQSGRYFSAPKLLWDMGNPFVGPVPDRCTFRFRSVSKTYKLKYTDATVGDIQIATETAAGEAKPKLSVEKWGDRGWWIGMPSMLESEDWADFFDQIERHKEEIRSAPLVVVDVRGNSGGDSTYPDRLAKILWGEEFVQVFTPYQGNEIYRVSPLNRKFFVDSLQEFKEKHEVNEYVGPFSELVSKMDSAASSATPLVVMRNAVPKRPPLRPPNPMKGSVVLLTDYACNSACLDMMDLYIRLPNTLQAGTITTADTIFMEVTRIDLPSGKAGLSFGHKAWIARRRGSNVPYKPLPAYTYSGDLGDDQAMRRWAAGLQLARASSQ